MYKPSRRILIYAAIAIGIVAILAITLIPDPVEVDTSVVERGSMRVTVDEKGETRTRDSFALNAPVAGELQRIELREGAKVEKGAVVAVIEPLPLDPRQRQELSARRDTAVSALREVRSLAEKAEAALSLARSERQRIEALAGEGIASDEERDRARTAEETARNEMDAARNRIRAAQSDLEAAQASLLSVDGSNGDRSIELRSPVSGEILTIPERSGRVVQAGEPILVISDSRDIEIVIEMLSTEAVKVEPGDPVMIEDWGGERPLQGTVRLVEPSGFTKISALGIEEQRVNVIVDLDEVPGSLGDGYRVEARVVVWRDDEVLHIPISALFRKGEEWAVFVVEDGRAVVRVVEIGHQNDVQAEVLGGIEEGEVVILHPSNALTEGVRVEPQTES